MRSRLSPTEKTDIWSRWKAGQTLHEIGRAYGKPHNSIRCLLLPRGGLNEPILLCNHFLGRDTGFHNPVVQEAASLFGDQTSGREVTISDA